MPRFISAIAVMALAILVSPGLASRAVGGGGGEMVMVSSHTTSVETAPFYITIHTSHILFICFFFSSPKQSKQSRKLAVAAPSGYGQVGQTLDGVVDSDGTITGNKDIGFGASIALSSNDGTRLVVGAHNFTATDGLGTPVEEGGAVFLYDYDGLTGAWVYKTHWTGLADEELGRWPVSISPNGQLVAIRRGTANRPAEIWSVTNAGIKTKLGGDITCADAGSMVVLTETSDGTPRLAAACEFDGAEESGNVNVYDWNGTEWVAMTASSLSVDSSGTTGGLFGFDMSFALEGTRLAVSAPNFNVSSGNEGLVAVFDYVDASSSWIQLGQNITGVQQTEKFGFTMDLSEDGNTLVVGSPNKDVGGLTDSGAVQGTSCAVYEFRTRAVIRIHSHTIFFASSSIQSTLSIRLQTRGIPSKRLLVSKLVIHLVVESM